MELGAERTDLLGTGQVRSGVAGRAATAAAGPVLRVKQMRMRQAATQQQSQWHSSSSKMHHRIVITAATSTNVAVVVIAMTNHVVNLPKSDVQ
jgi:2-methylcitrate dehydratase PrpD